MKKIFTLIGLTFFYSFSVFGQVNKGSILLGGDFNAFTEKQEINSQEFDNNGIFLSPLVGKALKNNLITGIYLEFGYGKNENDQTWNLVENNIYGAGFFLRNYKKIKNDFYGFLQGNLGYFYSRYKFEQTGFGYENKQSGIAIALSPGLSYKISRKLHLEAGLRELASIGYSVSKHHDFNQLSTSDTKAKRFSISSSLNNFNSNLYFGFRLLIDKKQKTPI